MKPIVYSCYDTGVIDESDERFPAGYSVVKKYPVVYAENRSRFACPHRIYALPFLDKPERTYLGADRDGITPYDRELREILTEKERSLLARLKSFEENEYCIIKREEDAELLRGMAKSSDDYEIIHTRVAGSGDAFPESWCFLGYDVCYEVECGGGFSIICDCMFICRWHGCDDEGTLFIEDYEKLNENGLFGSWNDAYRYMVKYLNQDWSERGDYAIYEVRGKNTD
ncbi:MAG: hypothetical protein II155_04720 [Clostridia bacterium]|nr:hypothetical protein [Clostridia bacterium]